MRGMLVVCLLVAVAVPAQAVIVQHVTDHSSGWRGGTNISPNYAWLTNWPNSNADGTLGEFSHTDLQTAISNTLATYGGWDAKVIVSQVSWISDPIPGDLDPVVVAVDIDQDTLVWGSSNVVNAGSGSWMYDGSTYANFVAAVNAGAANGDSVIVDSASWEAIWDTSLPAACWNIVVDVPESLIRSYLDNPSSDGFFVGAQKTDGYVNVFYGDQWGQQANIRVSIDQPPQTAPWITLDKYSIDLNVSLTDPVAPPQTVTVTNAGTGSLSWTASENPNVTWMSLQNASGGHGDSFNVLIDVTGLSPGDYSSSVEVTDNSANNSPQVVAVNVTVLPTTEPVIELVPDTLDLSLAPIDPAPAPIPVTVNNVGLGTLSWTAAENPDETWMSLTSASGSDGDAFNVVIDHSGLSRGMHTGYVDVTDLGATNSPQTLTVNLEIRDQDANITTANSYDDAWESGPSGWVDYCQSLYTAWSGTTGFVVHLGDSITYANPFGQWARYGSGKTAEDIAVCNWMHSDVWGDGTNNSANGWYLAAYDQPGGRSFTAESGIRADQYLVGAADLPSMDEMYTPGFTNPDGKQYNDAVMGVLMLGTNDASSNRTPAAMIADLEAIVDKMLAQNIIVCLSTLPPKRNDQTDVQNYNVEIRNLAQTKKLPLIDFYEECLRRRPGTSWDGTLISSDGVHPSTSGGGFTSSSDPYASNGAALSEVGYLLRCWLSVQKIREIKEKVIDAGPPDTTPPADITDLAASNPQAYSVDLTWTAPGDDGTTGTASSYDVRYSTATISEANWGSATQASGEPSPSSAGSPESMTVSGLSSETTYFFAIKTRDEVPNESGLSNVVSETTTEGQAQTWNVTTIGELETATRNYNAGDEILIAAGTYVLDSYLNLNNGQVLIHGATGNPSNVILQGPGINADVDPKNGLLVGSDDVTIEDLMITGVFWNGIQIRGEIDTDRTVIRNLRLIDCGERYIKCSTNGSDANSIAEDVLIEDVYMEQTQDLTAHPDNDYIGGIDAMGIHNWTVHNCVAVNIHGATGGGRGGVFWWQGVTNPTVEQNLLLNCDRGIAMGNASPPTHAYAGNNHVNGGIVRNNFIVRGVGIGLELSYVANLKVYHNTVYSDDASYWRTVQIYDNAGQTTSLEVAYNLIRGQIDESSTGDYTLTGNITGSNVWPSWFVDPLNGDLHLTNQATPALDAAPSLAEVTDDYDGEARSATPDLGADETALSPPVVQFDVTGSSGDESATTVYVTASMDRTHGYTTTVDYAVTGGTAVSPDDFTVAGTQLTFDPGITSQDIVITVVDDGLVESDETIEVTLSNPSNATLGANTVRTYTIQDNDTGMPLVAFDLTASSGDESVTPVNLSVSLSASSAQTVTVDFAVTGGTAVNPDDFTIAASPLTFNPGVTQQNIVITVVDDGLVEADETIEVTLSNPSNATLGANTVHTYTILDNDVAGGTGLTGAYYDNIDFTAFALSRVDATVNFNWGSGSPDPSMGADTFSVRWIGQVQPLYSETYTFYTNTDDGVRLWVDGQLIVDHWVDQGPTEWSGTIALSAGVKYDIEMEYYENGGGAVAELRWSSASQAKEIIPQGQLYPGELPPPTVQFDLTSSSGDESVTPASLSVSLSAASAQTVTVDYAVTGGTATGGGVDYTLAAGTLTFDPNDVSKTIDMAIVEDGLDELDETVEVTL
ncbi:MAG TPA: Calx-beta domain-containing protein, partial [Phycisphaerae bacterium]|nr:Calx-beta domain-containing protein [Phycisphaerae bacterium]